MHSKAQLDLLYQKLHQKDCLPWNINKGAALTEWSIEQPHKVDLQISVNL